MKQGVEVTIISGVPRWFFEDKFVNTPNQWTLLEEKVDVGLFQRHALKSDLHKTIQCLQHFWENSEPKIQKIMAFLAKKNPTLAYLDIPAIGVLVAERLNIPTVALGNFSWDWIYKDFINHENEVLPAHDRHMLQKAINNHQGLYSKVNKLLKLPYPGDFSAFQNAEICLLNWVGETKHNPRSKTLKNLGFDPDKKYILFSFGGHELPNFTLNNWPNGCEFQPLIIADDKNLDKRFTRTNQELSKNDVSYADVIAAASVIVTKPGYGIVTDCIFNQIPMIHMPRGRFAEYPTLLKALDENLNHVLIQSEDISPEKIITLAKQLVNQKAKPISIPLNGVAQAVAEINRML